MLRWCMTRLKLVENGHSPREPLDEHEINLNRIDALINSIASYEDPEDPYYFLLANALVDLVKAKHMYLAWQDEEF